MPVQITPLGQIGDAVMTGAYRESIDANRAAAKRKQTGQDLQQSGLSGSVGTDKSDTPAGRHFEVNSVECGPVLAWISGGQVVDEDSGRSRYSMALSTPAVGEARVSPGRPGESILLG